MEKEIITLIERGEEVRTISAGLASPVGHEMAPFIGREPVFGVFPPYFLWTVLIVLVIAIIFYWLLRSSGRHETALDILKKRYASGEIDEGTYRKMKEEIAGD